MKDFYDNCLNYPDGSSPSLPTFWIPRRRDIFLITRFFQLCSCGEILDLGCGNGFLAHLLAFEGMKVCAVDLLPSFCDFSGLISFNEVSLNTNVSDSSSETPSDVDPVPDTSPDSPSDPASVSVSTSPSFSSFHPSNLRFLRKNALDLPPDTFDGVFLSWADRGVNKAFMVQRQNPLAVAYIIETTGLTGDRECRYIFDLLDAYHPLMYWDNVNHRDLESAVFHRESGMEDFPASSHNRVILFLRRNIQGDVQRNIEETLMSEAHRCPTPYPWEKELDSHFPVGMQAEDGRKTLWKPVVIKDEERFLKRFCRENVYMAGIVR